MQMTGAQALIKSLEMEGTEVMFGLPGGAILPVYDPLLAAIGTDAFQECDTTGITMPVTKHNWLIQRASDIPTVIREAFYVATTGRPGPVLVDIPKDIANQTMEWYWPDGVDLPGFRAPPPPDP